MRRRKKTEEERKDKKKVQIDKKASEVPLAH